MPRAFAHRLIGAGVGGLTAAAIVKDEAADVKMVVTLAAVASGWFGGALPDILEPAANPHHRDFFHSLAAGAIVTGVGGKCVAELKEFALSEARNTRILRESLPEGDQRRTGLALKETFLLLAVGCMIGLVAGYLSHLAADSATSRSIPLVSSDII